ncbi:uncharacterized protein [Diabrotica undecimpunctata]|uniref:uncharacterized protein n=1 Tax=Diabrotica undecimpunctata TaxID=50387 RepID=UPI003B638E02
MYRQVLITPEQQNLQQILWRFDQSEDLYSWVLSRFEELQNSERYVLKVVQNQAFKLEIQRLSSKGTLHPKSNIISLHPFINNDGLLCVGGRLRNSLFSQDKRHPVLLPFSHHVTKLLFKDIHIRSLHPQQLLYLMREKCWPIHGKNTAKAVVRNCVTCFKAHPSSVNPIMGDLPAARVQPLFPFAVTAVDYAGPFLLKHRRGRGCKTYKGYVCLFVCLSTKALHLELVSDQSTQTFLSALKRFISRRGKPTQLMSDNGSNFTGAFNELNALKGILNSRPLSPLSNDPFDLKPLTPSHFLIGRPISSIPKDNISNERETGLHLHERLQFLQQHFWKRWSLEYISELQQRQKWKVNRSKVKINTLVLIKDRKLPSKKWFLGRVRDLYPGHDGVTRVISVQTSNGVLRRAVSNICPLPVETDK